MPNDNAKGAILVGAAIVAAVGAALALSAGPAAEAAEAPPAGQPSGTLAGFTVTIR